MIRRLPSLLLALPFLLGASRPMTPAPEAKLAPWLLDRLERGGADSFLVLFDHSASLGKVLEGARLSPLPAGRAVYETLSTRSRATQASARAWLASRGVPARPLWIVNGLQVFGDLDLARALAARPEVVRIVGDPAVRGIDAFESASEGTDGIEWGVLAVRADQVWSLDGATGEGIVLASADTGVEWTHPALRDRYRGWDGASAGHAYHWHDTVEPTLAPIDDHDHGTHTVGTMVGDDGAGNRIGVAPGARWIACRNMDHGVGRPSTYLECNQWFLAPFPLGGDPEIDGDPSKAPDVVNNSWGCPPSEGCDPAVLLDSFRALRAAGILAVAAAGNSGPSCSTVSDPPAIYEEAFVVGATDASDTLSYFSSRGSVTVDGSGRVRPDVSAPGQGVRSSVRGGGYASFSGTSMASPHAAGAFALLWSAKPQVKGLLRISRCLVARASAFPVGLPWNQSCGGTSRFQRPNNMFGWGRVDAYAAIHYGPDGDADGIADACDCAPADGGAYDAPQEAGGVAWDADRVTVRWIRLDREAGSGTAYDLTRGSLAELRATAAYSGGTCLGAAIPAAEATDPETPPVDDGFWYLVRPRNACGIGTWGNDSAGLARNPDGCP
jgi:subtilisin family serine protease